MLIRVHPAEPLTEMTSNIKIVVFMGSIRDGRMCERVSTYVTKALEKAGVLPTVFDPLTMDFQSIHQPLLFVRDQSATPAWLLEANETVKSADGFVVVHSEYNCGIPPALSHMMNCFPPLSYRHRPCSIVTYSMGDFGGVRAATLIQPFLSELGMVALPSRVVLPTVDSKFNVDGEPNNKRFVSSVERMIKELLWYADALKRAKQVSTLP